MRASDIISLSAVSVSRGKFRVTLPILSVSIGIAAVVLLVSVGSIVTEKIDEKLGGFGLDGIMVYAGEGGGLSASDGGVLTETISEVEGAMPFEFWFAYYNAVDTKNEPCLILGTDENLSNYMDVRIICGRALSAEDCSLGQSVCIVDSRLAEEKFGHFSIVGEKIVLEADGISLEFEVVGVCSSSMETVTGMLGLDIPPFIYIPWTAMGLDENSDVGQLVLKVRDGADSAKTAEKVKDYFVRSRRQGKYFDVEDMAYYRKELIEVSRIITLVLGGTAGISLLVAALGIMGLTFSGVNERSSEIGICKSMGASSFEICLMFLLESVIITLIGCLLGVASGLCLLFAGCYYLFGAFPSVDPVSLAVPCLVALAVGLISGVAPAYKAAKLSPLSAIRRE